MGKQYKKLTRSERHSIQILAKLTLETGEGRGESYICNTINISTSGALVETGVIIAAGSLLKYSCCIPGITNPLNITGEVVRGERLEGFNDCKAKGDSSLHRFGIMFLDMDEDGRQALESYFIDNSRKRPPQDAKDRTLE